MFLYFKFFRNNFDFSKILLMLKKHKQTLKIQNIWD